MTNPATQHQDRNTLTSTAELHGTIEQLLKAASQRQIWFLFLDEHARLIDPIMPMNDHPEDPKELHEIEDLGRVTFPAVLVHRTREIAKMIGASSFIVVWERPGGKELTVADRSWCEAIAGCAVTCDPWTVQLRAMFLMHDDGVRLIADLEFDFEPGSEFDDERRRPSAS